MFKIDIEAHKKALEESLIKLQNRMNELSAQSSNNDQSTTIVKAALEEKT